MIIDTTLRITLIAGIVFYFILIFVFLKYKALSLKYTLLWLLAGLVMLFFVFFPQVLYTITGWLGIQSGMNGLFLICIGFIMIILMSLTSIVSRQRNKIKTLTQEMAVLEKRLRELEEIKMEKLQH